MSVGKIRAANREPWQEAKSAGMKKGWGGWLGAGLRYVRQGRLEAGCPQGKRCVMVKDQKYGIGCTLKQHWKQGKQETAVDKI